MSGNILTVFDIFLPCTVFKTLVTKSMPEANCSIFGCTKSRTTKGLAIFSIPKKDYEWHRDWREKLVNIIAKDKEIDANLEARFKENCCIYVSFTLPKISLFVVSSNIYIFFIYYAYLISDRLREGIFISLILYQSC